MTRYDLDAEMRAFVERSLSFYGEGGPADLETERAEYREMARAFDAPRPAGVVVHDDVVASPAGGIPVRHYRPAGAAPLPLLVYFHGGGWVLGDLESHDSVTAEIADAAGVGVLAVDYRLAPENPYPAAHEDCWTVLKAIAADPARFDAAGMPLAVGGDSAGAHLAAGMTLLARREGSPALAGQVLIYGTFGADYAVPSYDECADAPMLTTADMRHYREAYFGVEDVPQEPLAAPVLAERLEGLPPAFVQAVEYDPLRDESVAYARRLEDAGVPVELHVEQGLTHGILRARHESARARAAFDRLTAAVRRLLHGG